MNPGTPAASPRPSLSLKTWLAAVGLLLVLLGAVIGWRLAHQEREVQHCSRFLLNTVCSLHVPGGPEWGPVLDRVLDETARLNVLFNPHDPQSPVYAFNVRHEPVRDPEIAAVVAAALQVSRESGGAFDVTIFPLVSLWREARRQNRPPPPAAIEQAKTRVDWRRLSVADSRVDKAKPEVQMDLGGIAKGYAAGLAARRLQAAGVRAGLVDFGGNVVAFGRMGRRGWKIGVQDPRGTGLIGVLEVRDAAVSTSGDYERYFEADGVRYHHLLDPHTGRPAHGMRSVTVVAKDPVLADAWSTAFFVRGPAWTAAYCGQHPEVEALWVDAAGTLGMSPSLAPRFKRTRAR